MGVAIWILFGLVAGSVAIRVMPGPIAGGIGVAMLVGVAGGLIGGLLGVMSTGDTSTDFNVRDMLMAIIGALFLLFSYRCFAMRSAA